MKKLTSLILAICMCAGLISCGGAPSGNTAATTQQAATTTAAATTTTAAATEAVTEATTKAATTAAAAQEKTTQETTAANADSGSETVEAFTMKYVIPGDLSIDEEAVLAVVNEKLAADGVPVKVERQAIPWGVWADKTNLMLTSGEEFDMIHIMQDWIPYNSYYSRGVLADVTEHVNKYGPNLKNYIPKEMWDDSRIGGRNYIIPTYWVEIAVDNNIFYRKDVFEKYNLQIPKTPADILDCFRTVRADWESVNLPIINFSIPSYDAAVLQLSPKLHRSYDAYPFIVKDAFFQVFQDGKVASWFESGEFKKDCAFMHEAYSEGIIQPDVLSVNFDWYNNYNLSGDGFLWTVPGYKDCLKNNPNLLTTDDASFRLNPEKPATRNWGIKNCNAVPVTSKNPHGAVIFINWLLNSQENYDLFIYGVEGEQWKRDPKDPRGVDYILDPVTNSLKWDGVSWMIGNLKYIRYDSTGFMEYNSIAFTEDPTAVNSIAGAFFFDASGLSTEYANVQAEAAVVMTPIVMGVQSYDEYYTAAIQRLKTAGLDALVAEYQNQLSAAIAAR